MITNQRSGGKVTDPSITPDEETLLIDALSSMHPDAKRNSLRRMITHGRVRVDGERAEHPRPVSYTHLTLPTICSV